MKSKAKFVLLSLVMIGSLYGLNAFYNGEDYIKVRTPPITGFQAAETGERCQTSTGEVICILNNKNYGRNLGGCRLYCRADSGSVSNGGNTIQPGNSNPAQSDDKTAGANLVVRLIDPPSRMFKGDEYRVNVRISNVGDESTSENEKPGKNGFLTSLKLLDGNGGLKAEIGNPMPVGRLSAGDSVTETFTWTPTESLSEGVYEYNAEVDIDNRITETNENDNLEDDYRVSISSRTARDGPDLTIDIISVTDESGNPVTELVTNRKYYVNTVIKNVGNEKISKWFVSTIRHSRGSVSGTCRYSQFGPAELNRLDRLSWNCHWTVPDSLQEGAYDLIANVDTQRQIEESDEHNRVLERIRIRKATSSNLAVHSASAVPGNNNRWNVETVFKNEGETKKEIKGFIRIEARILKGSSVVCKDEHFIYDDVMPGGSVSRTLQFADRAEGCILDRGQHVLEIYLEGKRLYRRAFDSGGGSLQCPSASGRIVLGHRTESGLYCHESGVLKAQKTNGQACTNSYECRSNLCLSGKCVGSCTYRRGNDELVAPAGVRIGQTQYCSADNRVHSLKSDGNECEGHYQCRSGICFDRVCISETAIKRSLCQNGDRRFC